MVFFLSDNEWVSPVVAVVAGSACLAVGPVAAPFTSDRDFIQFVEALRSWGFVLSAAFRAGCPGEHLFDEVGFFWVNNAHACLTGSPSFCHVASHFWHVYRPSASTADPLHQPDGNNT